VVSSIELNVCLIEKEAMSKLLNYTCVEIGAVFINLLFMLITVSFPICRS